MRIMHTFRLKVNSSGMPIGLCRPRPGSIDGFAMPYSLSRGVHQRLKQNTLRILRIEDCHIFGVKPKSLHPEKPNEEFVRIWKQFGSPCHRETINATHNGDCVHFWIEGGQLGNANWPVQTETRIDWLVCNAIQPVTRCPPTPPTKH
jgi:hypothetical protein